MKLPNLMNFNQSHPLMKMGYQTHRPLPISQSLVKEWHSCQRKAFFRYALGLVRHGVLTPEALFIGTCVHEAMRHLASGATPDFVARRLGVLARQELEEAATAEGALPRDADIIVTQRKAKALAMATAFYELLEDKWKNLNAEVLYVEHTIKVQIPPEVLRAKGIRRKNPLELVGQIDLATREKGDVVINDYKTTSVPPADRARVASFDIQAPFYRLLHEGLEGEMLTADKFRNYILLKPTIRLKQKETYDEYLERVGEWYKDKQASDPNDPPMVVSTLRYEPDLYPDEMMRQIVPVWRAFSGPYNVKYFPRTGAPYQCIKQGQVCPYLDLCQSDPVTWTDQIALQYKQEFRYEDQAGAQS